MSSDSAAMDSASLVFRCIHIATLGLNGHERWVILRGLPKRHRGTIPKHCIGPMPKTLRFESTRWTNGSKRLKKRLCPFNLPQRPQWKPKVRQKTLLALDDPDLALVGRSPGSRWLLWLQLHWLRPIKHNNIPDPGDEMAAGLFCELRGEFLLFLFVVLELHLDQFVMFQRLVQSGQELRTQTLLAHLQRRLEPLSLGFEITYLGIGQTIHRTKIRKFTQKTMMNSVQFRR
jgi:hypothetical protein